MRENRDQKNSENGHFLRGESSSRWCYLSYIKSLKANYFKLWTETYDEVLKNLKFLRKDCSVRYDNISVSFIKPVAEQIASSLTYIIIWWKNQNFQTNWKLLISVQYQKFLVPRSSHRKCSIEKWSS